MNIRVKSLMLLFLLQGAIVLAQAPLNSSIHPVGLYSFQLAYHRGTVLKTNDFVSGNNASGHPISFHQALSFRFARQTIGSKSWEKAYGYPRYGAGLYAADFHSQEIGRPVALYGFLTGPFFKTGRFSVTYDFAAGVAFNLNKYDPVTNPFNTAFGSSVNSYEEMGVNLEYCIDNRLSLTAGYVQTHYSNGGLILPNKGMNMSSFRSSVHYKLYSDASFVPKTAADSFKPIQEWTASVFASVKCIELPPLFDAGSGSRIIVPCFSSGLITFYSWQLCHKIRTGAGITLDYNGISNPQFSNTGNSKRLMRNLDNRRLEASLNTSYELVFNRFSIVVHSGFYLYRHELIKGSPVFYQRAGVKYYLSDSIFASILIRAKQFKEAEFLEWIVGFRI